MKRVLLIFAAIILLIFAGAFLGFLAPRFIEGLATQANIANFPPASDFSLESTSGPAFRLSDHRGKVVILTFWASWNEVSLKQLDESRKYEQSYPTSDVLVVPINNQEDPEKGRAILILEGFEDGYSLFDQSGEIGNSYDLGTLPFTVFINRGGLVAATHVGLLSVDDLHSLISPLR